MLNSALSIAFLFLLLSCDLAAASSALARSPRRHSSLARRNQAHLTKRAQRCSGASDLAAGNGSAVTGLVKSNFLCSGQPSGATHKVTATGGPNGLQSWLNCGIDAPKGWNPPPLAVNNVVTMSLATALKSKDSPFHACSPFLPFFEKHAAANKLPAILLASFSMQESGCNPSTIGGAGEEGLMQITPEKCHGAPHGNCLDPDFNIGTAARYFAQTLEENGGNLLLSVGNYNGWRRNLTHAEATAAAHTDCCRCQNNLDYPMQFFNGWLLNLNPYKLKLGSIFNLQVCKQQT